MFVIITLTDPERSETEPFYHLLYGGEELLFFLLWVGVIITQESDTSMCFRVTEVEVDGFRVPDVEDTIRLRGEPSAHLQNNYPILFTLY